MVCNYVQKYTQPSCYKEPKTFKELKEMIKSEYEDVRKNAGKMIMDLSDTMKPANENCRNCGAPHSGRCEYCGTSYK
jgi:hypothetical protein